MNSQSLFGDHLSNSIEFFIATCYKIGKEQIEQQIYESNETDIFQNWPEGKADRLAEEEWDSCKIYILYCLSASFLVELKTPNLAEGAEF